VVASREGSREGSLEGGEGGDEGAPALEPGLVPLWLRVLWAVTSLHTSTRPCASTSSSAWVWACGGEHPWCRCAAVPGG